MRTLSLAAVSALALSAAACGPHMNPALRTRLDCPERQGVLVRASISPDGKSCLYRSGEVEVNLQLTPVSGDPATTLNAVEASLVGPKVAPAADNASAAAATSGGASAAAAAAPSPSSSDEAARAAQEARQDAGAAAASDHADQDWGSGRHAVVIDRSGRHLASAGADDRDDNDRAHVDLPGIHIDADNDNAQVDVAGVHIDADNDQATVRVMRDVRLAGEGLSRERNGVRATFIARRDDLPGGYRLVGYEAAGPKSGPLTVATVRSRSDMDNHGRLYNDIRRLVRRNGGA